MLDPRINPYRLDLAAERLRGKVESARFAEGKAMQAAQGIGPLYKNADFLAEQVSQLRYGDPFTVYESRDGWVWGQSERDGYVGYTRAAGLSDRFFTPTHRINNLASLVFADASVKAPILDRLTLFSPVETLDEQAGEAKAGGGGQRFFELRTGGYMHRSHLTPIAQWQAPDYVATAERLLHVPYMWGGISPLGIDCSGLLQLALETAGISCPRDSDMQAAALGDKIADGIKDVIFKRGDMVFMAGHVGIMADAAHLLHSNAYHGKVVIEPLADVAGRYDGAFSVRRF